MRCSSQLLISMASSGLSPTYLLLLRIPDAALQVASQETWAAVENQLPQLSAHISFEVFCAASAHFQEMVDASCLPASLVFLPRVALNPFSAHQIFFGGLPWPICRTLHMDLFNSIRLASAHISRRQSPSELHLVPRPCQLQHIAWCCQTCWEYTQYHGSCFWKRC